jgi:integrase/recombinase XerC
MRDAGSGQPAFRQAVHPVPGEPVFLAAALERVVPVPGYLVPEETHRLVVTVHRVIVLVPGDHAGLRRTETSKLDLVDFGRNPAAPEFGRYGMLNVRYGKAKKGQPPRRRNVAAVMGWAVEAVVDYAENVRPRFGCEDHPALWVTERGGRVKPAEINARFVAYRDALGLPSALVVHSLKHSYVTHLTEDGVDRRFIQGQVGHENDSSTAVYTHVSDDFMNAALRRALAPALGTDRGSRPGGKERR